MKKNFLIFFVFVTISSKDIPVIIYNENTKFDKDNNEFNVEYTGEKTGLLIYVTQQNNISTVYLNCTNETESEEMSGPGGGQILNIFEAACFLSIVGYQEEAKGTVWIYPMNKEIDIDLSQKYGKLYSIINYFDLYPTLTYNIKNLDKDVKCIFDYSSTFTLADMLVTGLLNPFKVCHDDDCSENIKTYDFKKGNNYKIYIKQETKEFEYHQYNVTYNFMAGYSFYPKDDKKSGNNFIILKKS